MLSTRNNNICAAAATVQSMRNVCKIIAIALILAIQLVAIDADERRLRDFRDIYNTARKLESAGMLATNDDAKLIALRKELLFAFAREPKSAITNRQYQQLNKLINDYKIKAYQYVQECQKQNNNNNWFTKIITFGGAMGSLKGLSKADSYLISLTERYEQQGKAGQLKDEIVDRDMAKFQLRGLDMIMFVLATDVKYLATENVQILNTAIDQQLQANKFVANNNFYEVDELTKGQQKLLLDYYASRVNNEQVTVRETIEHALKPNNLIIGRLLDSCHSVQYYKDEWAQVLPKCGDECSNEDTIFYNKINIIRYEDVVNFCEQFLDAL